MRTNPQTGRRTAKTPSAPEAFFAGGGEYYFLPADKPIFARDALGRTLKITRLCELDADTLFFVAEITRREEAGKGDALCAE